MGELLADDEVAQWVAMPGTDAFRRDEIQRELDVVNGAENAIPRSLSTSHVPDGADDGAACGWCPGIARCWFPYLVVISAISQHPLFFLLLLHGTQMRRPTRLHGGARSRLLLSACLTWRLRASWAPGWTWWPFPASLGAAPLCRAETIAAASTTPSRRRPTGATMPTATKSSGRRSSPTSPFRESIGRRVSSGLVRDVVAG